MSSKDGASANEAVVSTSHTAMFTSLHAQACAVLCSAYIFFVVNSTNTPPLSQVQVRAVTFPPPPPMKICSTDRTMYHAMLTLSKYTYRGLGRPPKVFDERQPVLVAGVPALGGLRVKVLGRGHVRRHQLRNKPTRLL